MVLPSRSGGISTRRRSRGLPSQVVEALFSRRVAPILFAVALLGVLYSSDLLLPATFESTLANIDTTKTGLEESNSEKGNDDLTFGVSLRGLAKDAEEPNAKEVKEAIKQASLSLNEVEEKPETTDSVDIPSKDDKEEDAVMDSRSVALLEGGGFVGAKLAEKLRAEGFFVTVFDNSPKVPTSLNPQVKNVNDLVKADLEKSRFVVYLGNDSNSNSNDVVSILNHLSLSQHFVAMFSHQKQHQKKVIKNIGDSEMTFYGPELDLHDHVQSHKETTPKVTVLRLGSVAGISPSHHTEETILSMLSSAYTSGAIEVEHGGETLSFLWMQDLLRATKELLTQAGTTEKFNVWSLASFNARTMRVATTIASLTGAKVHVRNMGEEKEVTIDPKTFEAAFDFKFSGSLESVLNEMEENVPASITPTGPYELVSKDEEHNMPCPVCGSRHHQDVLDIGMQPFANDFQKDVEKALASERFPLKLVRCKVCNHLHLSHLASRDDLFDHYLYQSATSRTLAKYFDWLAEKIIRESGTKEGSILEIACNDGTQLNFFKKAGWQTFGVDPAANLVPLAVKQGHQVKVGYWGADLVFPELPTGNKLNAIVAQNVYAHVPDNVAFLKKCVDVMGPTTKVYIQTSQCHMHQLGQFDTAYHEHVSFFTAHSFQKAAELAGLVITNFEITPIHGTSCLVTMMLPGEPQRIADNSTSLKDRLALEVKDGITSDYFYQKYEARAHQTRKWIVSQLNRFREQGYQIISYGAAAKGMVLLHFFMESPEAKEINIEFIVDDAELKQNTYCAGTRIPVRPTSSLKDNTKTDKPTVVLVLAWNFWAEIAENIKRELKGHKEEVMVLLPFPTPRLVRLKMDSGSEHPILLTMPFFPTTIPNPLRDSSRRKAVLLFDLCEDDKHLLGHFIVHHAHMFDHAVALNKCNHEGSALVLSDAPLTWEVVTSESEVATHIKKHVSMASEVWTVSLSTSEFLVQSMFREELMQLGQSSKLAELCVVSSDGHGEASLISKYHEYFSDGGTGRVVSVFNPESDIEVAIKPVSETLESPSKGFVAKFGCQRKDEALHDFGSLDDAYAMVHHSVTF